MKKEDQNDININSTDMGYSIEDKMRLQEPSNREVMYQQENATKRIIKAIENTGKDIQDSISTKDNKDADVENFSKMGQNDIMEQQNCENCKDTIKELSTKYQILDNNISNTNKIISIVGTVLGLILSIFIFSVSSQYSAIKDSTDSKFDSISTKIDAINQRLDYQEKLNSMQIQRDVSVEVNKKK